MVQAEQHQEPVRHAVEAAERAILNAQNAEYHLQAALSNANPDLIQSAQSELEQAKRQVADARAQLRTFDNEVYAQQIKQTLQQLEQSGQDLFFNEKKADMPKQVR